jgi:hypothetical protein
MTTIYEHFFSDDEYPVQAAAHQRELELQQQRELEDERQENRIRAIRACMTAGVSMKTIRFLCSELNVKYDSVVS